MRAVFSVVSRIFRPLTVSSYCHFKFFIGYQNEYLLKLNPKPPTSNINKNLHIARCVPSLSPSPQRRMHIKSLYSRKLRRGSIEMSTKKSILYFGVAAHFWFACYYDWNYVKIPPTVHPMGITYGRTNKLKFLTYWDAVSANYFYDYLCKRQIRQLNERHNLNISNFM